MRFCLALALGIALLAFAHAARADQRRDYMLENGSVGERLILDYFGTGGQLTVEHRGRVYGASNDYSLSSSVLVGYPLAQGSVSATFRLLFLEFGASAGYRAVWRNLSFAPGDHTYCADCDRPARRSKDPILGSGPDTDRYAFGSAWLQLYAPLNDYFVLTSQLMARYEGVRPRTYDWFYTDIHDAGVITQWETLAFVKHPKWGAIGPYLQVLSLPRAGHHEVEVAAGFNAVTRLGLIKRNDMLLLTVLMRPGDGYYGQHSYYAPVRALAIYRLSLSL
jgi:hypothetical protein